MMKFVLCLLALLCGFAGVARADEKPTAQITNAATALQNLKEQCDNPQASQKLAWPGYVSETELLRTQAIYDLKSEKNGLENARRELKTAKGEYRQMLVVALAALGDKDALAPAAKLMLSADKPAVRVVATLELRKLKDKALLDPFKQAMSDKFQRERGGCLGPKMLIYPVRMIASDALVDLGLARDEIRKLGDWQVLS